MKLTELLKLKLFERKDTKDFAVLNENFQTIEDAIDKRVPKTAIQNTNAVTSEGYVLDARQANPNMKGTMAEAIAILTSESDHVIEVEDGLTLDSLMWRTPAGKTKVYHGKKIAGTPVAAASNELIIVVRKPEGMNSTARIDVLDVNNNATYMIRCVGGEYKGWETVVYASKLPRRILRTTVTFDSIPVKPDRAMVTLSLLGRGFSSAPAVFISPKYSALNLEVVVQTTSASRISISAQGQTSSYGSTTLDLLIVE